MWGTNLVCVPTVHKGTSVRYCVLCSSCPEEGLQILCLLGVSPPIVSAHAGRALGVPLGDDRLEYPGCCIPLICLVHAGHACTGA